MNRFRANVVKAIFIAWVLAGAVVISVVSSTVFTQTNKPLTSGPATAQRASAVSKARWVQSYGKQPLSFEANAGQTNPAVKFLARSRAYTLFLTGDAAVLELQKQEARGRKPAGTTWLASAAPTVVRMRLVGANVHAAVTGAHELPGMSNYFIGKDPRNWRTNVPHYARVQFASVYPGVDLAYYGNQSGQLEYDFVVAPGADAASISLAFDGALQSVGRQSPMQSLKSKIDQNGDLVVQTHAGELRFHKPMVYQQADVAVSNNRKSSIANRQFPEGRYVLRGASQVGFEVSSYDHAKPLIIDPVLSYSTFLDGSSYDTIAGMAVDSSGHVYVTGFTTSSDFPTTTGALLTAFPGDTAYVSKLDPTGTTLIYSTYLGGAIGGASGQAIAADSLGDAYVAGTTSPLFPTTAGAYLTAFTGDTANFVAELNPAGTALVYSTFFPLVNGANLSLAVDGAGDAYFAGLYEPAQGQSLPTTTGAFQPTPPACAITSPSTCQTSFVTELNATGSALAYSTYLSGASISGIAVDSSGSAYVTGHYFPYTAEIGIPTTAGAFQPSPPACATNTPATCSVIFASKLNSTGSGLAYSTYIAGASGGGYASAIAVDSSANAYITGETDSTNFPVMNPIQGNLTGSSNAFVTKINAAGSSLVYSTYLGGSGTDIGQGIAVDAGGEAFVAGLTTSTNFPTENPFQARNQGGYEGYDVFVTELNAAGSALVASSYLGGTDDDYATGIGVDSAGNAYVAGYTYSTNFPTTPSAFQTTETATPCIHFPIGYVPFTSLYTNVTVPGYVWGEMTPAAYAALSTVPLPTQNTTPPYQQGFCEAVQLYTGGPYQSAAIPTVAQREGNFSSIATQLTNPVTGAPYPENIVPAPTTAPGPWLWPTNVDALFGNNDFVAKISLASAATPTLPTLAFGPQNIGLASAPMTETIINTGTDNLTIASVSVSGTNASDFTTSADTCTGAMLAATATCTVNVTFTPSAVGNLSASLNFTDNASSSPQAISLTGAGMGPLASLSAPSLIFSGQKVGATSASQPVMLSNTGSTALTITSITATANFAEQDNCNGSVAANGSCTVNVAFTPTVNGPLTGTLTITDNANGVAGSMQMVSLTGNGLAPLTITASSASMTYGGTVPAITAGYSGFLNGDTSASLTTQPTCTTTATTSSPAATYPSTCSGAASTNYTISYTAGTVNVGAAPLTITAPSATMNAGAALPSFTPAYSGFVNGDTAASLTTAPTCSTTATTSSPGGKYPITCSGAVDSNYTITYAAGTLTVNGPGVSFAPGSLTFTAQASGSTSTAQSITVNNPGSASLTFTAITASGPFAMASTGTTCSTSAPLGASGSCTVAVTFTPTAGGAASGSVSFTDNAANSPQMVLLSGTGQDFSFAPPSGSSTSSTVAPGSPASYTLSVGGEGGLTGNVSFTCTGAPSEATCTVSPNPVTAGNTPTNVTVTVTTTAASSALPRSRPLPPAPAIPSRGVGLLMLAMAVAGMAWTVGRRNPALRRRWQLAVVPLAVAILLLIGMTACGGGGSNTNMSTSNPGTPAGNYNLSVTGSTGTGSSAVSHTVTLQLDVS